MLSLFSGIRVFFSFSCKYLMLLICFLLYVCWNGVGIFLFINIKVMVVCRSLIWWVVCFGFLMWKFMIRLGILIFLSFLLMNLLVSFFNCLSILFLVVFDMFIDVCWEYVLSNFNSLMNLLLLYMNILCDVMLVLNLSIFLSCLVLRRFFIWVYILFIVMLFFFLKFCLKSFSMSWVIGVCWSLKKVWLLIMFLKIVWWFWLLR